MSSLNTAIMAKKNRFNSEKIPKLLKNIYPDNSNINTSDMESNVEISTSDEDLNNDQTQKDLKNVGRLLTLLKICYSAGLSSVSLQYKH